MSFKRTALKLLDLLAENKKDEYGVLSPTLHSFDTAMRLIIKAHDSLGDNFPIASCSTDENGSVRLTWSYSNSDKIEVRLICAADSDKSTFLYHEDNEKSEIQLSPTHKQLVDLLNWFDDRCFNDFTNNYNTSFEVEN